VEDSGQVSTAPENIRGDGPETIARRARVELHATGERVRKRSGADADQLTPQEPQVARLVAEGWSNREVAAPLFLSPNNVEYHLQKIFHMIGISSRTPVALFLLDQARP
jgi:DNA-binding NarL/FixJ family response regulator